MRFDQIKKCNECVAALNAKIERLVQLVELYELSLGKIEKEQNYVESKSTGSRQYFKTAGAEYANEALSLGETIKKGDGK